MELEGHLDAVLQEEWWDDVESLKHYFDAVLQEAILRYGEPLAEGRHRTIFRDGDWVIKVPTALSGIGACYEELSTQGECFAKTVREDLGREFGIPVVRMEFVTHRGWSADPDWTWSIDCGQVGYTKDGRLVAYDWEHAK